MKGNHSGWRVLVSKTIRAGYYWPTLRADAKSYVERCDACQRYANIHHQPPAPLTAINEPWPFAQWGIDLLGQLPLAPGRRKYLILAVDYFTKWAEARPLATITAGQMISFIWEQIVRRHGLPRVLITARQFDNADLRAFCQGNRIDHRFASVAHPQTNGQVEESNPPASSQEKAYGCGRGRHITWGNMGLQHHPQRTQRRNSI